MNPIRHIRRLAAALAGLACAWLGIAIAAPAAFAARSVPPPGGGSAGIASRPTPPGSYPCSPECSPLLTKHRVLPSGWTKHPPLPSGHVARPVYKVPVHTVVVGGMPGWQIALIVIGTALLAATAAVLAYRAWTIRSQPVPTAPEPRVPGADIMPVP